ncbi:MAG: nucleotidyltransferase family protein [Actinobacteria bacterium]|nr:MAG: nucleotidyltransferase family protein [Actinomycetota bacterium]
MIGVADRMLAVHDALRAAGLPHAIGGAIALGYCTLEARGTQDVDINVFVSPSRTREVFAALPDGVRVTARDLQLAERDGQVRLLWHATPIDVFFSVLPFHDEVERNIRHVSFGDRTIPVLDCTDLAVFKALFARPRDWVDIEAMVEARSLDVDEAMRWVREMVGDDPRVEQLAGLRALRRSQAEPPPVRPRPKDAADAGV